MKAASVHGALVDSFRALFDAEATLAEQLSRRKETLHHSIIDQWPTLEEFLHIYGGGLGPAGVLVLAGAPDAESSRTGIPFTGPDQARAQLDLTTSGSGTSAAGVTFWDAVHDVQARNKNAPLESLFSTVFLAHAVPFAVDTPFPELKQACAQHTRRLLKVLRPQIVVTTGAIALDVLGLATQNTDLSELASTDEGNWTKHWPAGSRPLAYPSAEATTRFRVAPLPALDGPHAAESRAALVHLLNYAWV